MSKRLSRLTLIAATAVGLAFSAGTAAANPSDTAFENRADDAPVGAVTHFDTTPPAGPAQGRKVG
jgi:hypothetical protein